MSSLANRYAKALFTQAQLRGALQDVENAASALAEALDADVLTHLANPTLDATSKVKALQESIKKAPQLLHDFITLVVEDGRAELLPAALKAFQTHVDVANNHVRAKVTSVSTLTDAQRKALTVQAKKMSNANSVTLEEHTDASLIGGLRLQVGSTLYDNSVKTKLQNLQNRLQNA